MENSFKTVSNFLTKCEEEGKDFYVSFCIAKIGVSIFYFNKENYEIFASPKNGLISILQGNDSIDIRFYEETKVSYYDYLAQEGVKVIRIYTDNSNNYIIIGENV